MRNNDKPKWYSVKVHTGKEDHVARLILDTAKSYGLEKKIIKTLVPTQRQVEIKGGKKVIKVKKLLPGYVLVYMVYDEETAALVTSIEEVRGFVRSGKDVVPLSQQEIDKFMRDEKSEEVKYKVKFMVNDAVRITDGIFKGQVGKVVEVDEQKGRIKVLISMLGTDIPYDLEITQVEKL